MIITPRTMRLLREEAMEESIWENQRKLRQAAAQKEYDDQVSQLEAEQLAEQEKQQRKTDFTNKLEYVKNISGQLRKVLKKNR